MGISIVEDIANLLADMPNQSLPVYPFQFSSDIVDCIAIFPLSGQGSTYFSDSTSPMGAIDRPGVQCQVRYTDPANAFVLCEAIRKWLDQNPPTGYTMLFTTRDQPQDVTSPEDLAMNGGPAYRFSCDFALTLVRS
jgi:hypothetical protein